MGDPTVRLIYGYIDLGYWVVGLYVESVYLSEFNAYAEHDDLTLWCKKNVEMADYGISGDGYGRLYFNFKTKADALGFKLQFAGK